MLVVCNKEDFKDVSINSPEVDADIYLSGGQDKQWDDLVKYEYLPTNTMNEWEAYCKDTVMSQYSEETLPDPIPDGWEEYCKGIAMSEYFGGAIPNSIPEVWNEYWNESKVTILEEYWAKYRNDFLNIYWDKNKDTIKKDSWTKYGDDFFKQNPEYFENYWSTRKSNILK